MDISGELVEISSYRGFFALRVGGDAAGWHPVGQSYANGCADLIDATVRYYHSADLRVGASLVHLGHATRLWSPVLACALAHGVIPHLQTLQRADDGAQLRMPEPVGEAVAAPSADLLYRIVVTDHMQPLAAGLQAKLAPALLAGNVASALVGASRALLAARPDLRHRIVDTTRELLHTGMMAGSGVITRLPLGFKRRSCCLFYRLQAQSLCGDCVFDRAPRPGAK